jgi:hypothetical protein
MIVDPRTGKLVAREADCHLIPECLGVSQRTVRLDGDFDNAIGSKCDNPNKRYIATWYGDVIEGRLSVVGGSKSLVALFSVSQQRFLIPKPKGASLEDFLKRALGSNNGTFVFEALVGRSVDTTAARVSMLNSAFLVLYHQGWRDFSGQAFERARMLMSSFFKGTLEGAALAEIQSMAWESVAFDTSKFPPGTTALSLDDLRKYYDPESDARDGVRESFPAKSITKDDRYLVVVLPYSNCLRGKVRFPLDEIGTCGPIAEISTPNTHAEEPSGGLVP